MIGCLRTRVRKKAIIALYFEFENELKFYNLEASISTALYRRASQSGKSGTVRESNQAIGVRKVHRRSIIKVPFFSLNWRKENKRCSMWVHPY